MTDFYSQAFNFASATQGHVDPRTGLFSLSMPIASLIGNDNLGPNLPLTLSYAPLSTVNAGLGIGCSFGLSQYDRGTKTLTLASGERYKIHETTSSVTLQQSLIPALLFEKRAADNAYKITRKSGDVEWLTGPDTGSDVKVPLKLLTPVGHCLDLKWDLRHGAPRLTTVTDEAGHVLLSIAYTDSLTTLTVWPDRPESHDIRLTFFNGYLKGIEHRSPTVSLAWALGYDTVGANTLLTSVTAPTGFVESVVYNDNVQRFPLAAHIAKGLPAVVRHTLAPSAKQPKVVTTYDYTGFNFLGYDTAGSGSWSADEDYLYGMPTSYRYGSTATCDGEVTKRTYNSYHLMTEESVADAQRVRTTTNHYDIKAGKPFNQQSPTFQFPKQTDVAYEDHSQGKNGDNTWPTRVETSLAEYNDNGNLTKQTSPDGTVTTWRYFPKEGAPGDDGAPADPNGFERLLQTQTVTPSPDYPDAPVQSIGYAYATLPTIAANRTQMPATAVVPVRKDLRSANRLLNRRTTRYQADASSTELGRITQLQEDRYAYAGEGVERDQIYTYTQDFTFSLDGDALAQTVTGTTHDKLVVTTSRSQSRWSGRIGETVDAQGNTAHYAYDSIGRIVSSIANRNTSYENAKRYAYGFDKDQDNQPLTVMTDAKGNQTNTWYDGMGRVVRQAQKAQDGKAWQDTDSRAYDARGRLLSSTSHDGSPKQQGNAQAGNADATSIAVTEQLTYDGWNRIGQLEHDIGCTIDCANDPVAMTVATQIAGPGQGVQVVHYNSLHLPDTVTKHPDGITKPGASVKRTYDGLGRLVDSTDELGNCTRYAYDAWGRVVSTTLPDGTVVTRQYAPDAGGDARLASIAVNGVSQGSQTFDGLGRLLSTTNGGRTHRYTYADAAAPVPATITAPDGTVTRCEYVKELGNAVSRVDAGPIAQTFGYDATTGSLVSALEAESFEHRLVYTPLGQLQDETFAPAGGASKTAHYTHSPNGLPLTYTDIAGVTRSIAYNAQAQPVSIADPDVGVQIVYDEIGRLKSWTATDLRDKRNLTTTFAYDPLNREQQRDVTIGADTWTIALGYAANGQLCTRTTQHNRTALRTETFGYDVRSRLVSYQCGGPASARPLDGYGNPIQSQTFDYDPLDNLVRCATTFDGGSDTATFTYDATDPNQLVTVAHTHAGYPAKIELTYDACGRLIKDEAGRTLRYDALGRLAGVEGGGAPGGSYRYDAHDRLVAQVVSNGETHDLYYSADLLVNEAIRESGETTRFLRANNACVAQRREGAQARTVLTGTDAQNSVLVASTPDAQQSYAYSPYGFRTPGNGDLTMLGFTGERLDPVSGTYHLGNGYRTYSPLLMRFQSPDSWSPFGSGGINPYAYCLGDPINRVDPTGHLSLFTWISIGVAALGIVAAVVTFGAAAAPIYAAEGMAAALWAGATEVGISGGLGVLADTTAIASGATEESHPGASKVLGWVSLGLGGLSIGANIGESVVKYRQATSLARNETAAPTVEGAVRSRSASSTASTGLGAAAGGTSAGAHAGSSSGGHGSDDDTASTQTTHLFQNGGSLSDAHESAASAHVASVRNASSLDQNASSGKVYKLSQNRDGDQTVGTIPAKSDPKVLPHPVLAAYGGSADVAGAGHYWKSRVFGDMRIVGHSAHYVPDRVQFSVARHLESLGVSGSFVRAESPMYGFQKLVDKMNNWLPSMGLGR